MCYVTFFTPRPGLNLSHFVKQVSSAEIYISPFMQFKILGGNQDKIMGVKSPHVINN